MFKNINYKIFVANIMTTKCTGWAKKGRNSVKSYSIKKISSRRLLGKFAVKWVLKISPHLAYVAMSLKVHKVV